MAFSRLNGCKITGLSLRSSACALLLLAVPATCHADYAAFLLDFETCAKNLRSQYSTDTEAEIYKTTFKSFLATANTKACKPYILHATERVLTEAHDCAKTAIFLRDIYLRGKSGKREGITSDLEDQIDTDDICPTDGVLARHAKCHDSKSEAEFYQEFYSQPKNARLTGPFIQATKYEPAFKQALEHVQPGQLLFFHNDRCLDMSHNPPGGHLNPNGFDGHTMTVLSVAERDHNGNAVELNVLQGHMDGIVPVVDTVKVTDILNTNIPGINCCIFRGIVTFNPETTGQGNWPEEIPSSGDGEGHPGAVP